MMYNRCSRDFQRWASDDGLPLNRSLDISTAMLEYLEELHFQGHNRDSGEKVIAALECQGPGLRSSETLERAKQSLMGYRRLAPGPSRAPMPWIGRCAMVGATLRISEFEFAQCLIFLFRTYLRPRECLGLRGAVPTKTEEFDWSLLLDSIELTYLYPRFITLKKRANHDMAWSFAYRKFSSLFERTAEVAGLVQANLQIDMMRHGGVRDDAARQARSLGAIKRRGRWAADASVKRCEKHAR
ncbi:unnamed protein product, partial [Prorocentrum cordatum]